MPGVDQFLGRRRRVGHDAEPGERIDPLVSAQSIVGNAGAADAVKAVAARNEVGLDLGALALVKKTHARPLRVDVVEDDVERLVDREPAGGGAAFAEILGRFGLPVDGHAGAGQLAKVDAPARAVDGDLDAFVDQRLALQPFGRAGAPHHLDRSRFEHAGANAPLDMGAIAPFEDDRLDPLAPENLGQQQSRRTGADDGDLRALNHFESRS